MARNPLRSKGLPAHVGDHDPGVGSQVATPLALGQTPSFVASDADGSGAEPAASPATGSRHEPIQSSADQQLGCGGADSSLVCSREPDRLATSRSIPFCTLDRGPTATGDGTRFQFTGSGTPQCTGERRCQRTMATVHRGSRRRPGRTGPFETTTITLSGSGWTSASDHFPDPSAAIDAFLSR